MNDQFLIELSEDQQIIKDTIREFAENRVKPALMERDEEQLFPSEIMSELGELGFLGILVSEEYGGAGLGYIEYTIVIEELAKTDPSLALSVAAHNGLCTNHIYVYGNDKLKEKFVKPLASGKVVGAWALTEPGSGSDAGALKTTAEHDGNEYVLNGSKNFITHGGVGGISVVMAITDKSKKKNGISAFVVEKDTPGYIVGKKENKLGMRSSETVQLTFDNCRIPEENLIGNEGEGFKQAMNTLVGGRISIAALSAGLAQGCLENSIRYSKERKQFNKTLSEFQATQIKLSDMATNISAARLLTYKAAFAKDNGKKAVRLAAQAKLFASEIAENAASQAVQIFGGYGYIKDYPVEKFYRDVKLLTIGEGTSEVNRIILAKDLINN